MERILLIQYLNWQFVDKPKEILRIWKNLLKFGLNYFSVPALLRSFFSHWHRYRYSYGKRFAPRRYFEVFIFNIFSRVIGVILRTTLIIFGLFGEVLIILTGLVVFLGWLVLPFFLISGLIFGIKMLF